jgi:hypothetical protein
MSYTMIGFDENFTRIDSDSQQEQDQEYQAELLSYGIPANNIVGGVMQSQNGNLQIDLNQGAITYNDGTTNLLQVGGQNNSVQIQNANASTILSSIVSTQ